MACGVAVGCLHLINIRARGFTRLSEKRLPYDVVYLLNQFFGAVGAAIQAQGGWIDKYLGDGLLAVFGRETGPEAGCRQALAAARAIDLALDGLNSRRGAVFSSNYEYPGRYTRWDTAIIDPPLVISARGRAMRIEALNSRGEVLLPAIVTSARPASDPWM